MSSTKRWLDEDSGASELERAVLGSGVAVPIPVGAREQGWEQLSAALAASAVLVATKPVAALASSAAASAGKGTATSLVSLAFVKGVVVGVVVCVALQFGVGFVASSGERVAPRVETSPVPPSAGPRAQATARPELVVDAPASAPAQKSVVAKAAASQAASERGSSGAAPALAASAADFAADASSASSLAQEASQLRRARAELRRGDFALALSTLESSSRDLRSPQLGQEREALVIEVLYRSGRSAEASRRAESYFLRFPDSPHRERLRALQAGPP